MKIETIKTLIKDFLGVKDIDRNAEKGFRKQRRLIEGVND